MTNQEIRAILEGFVDEVFDCASNKAARELDVRIKTFVKAHGCVFTFEARDIADNKQSKSKFDRFRGCTRKCLLAAFHALHSSRSFLVFKSGSHRFGSGS